jgi:hypothetical protein
MILKYLIYLKNILVMVVVAIIIFYIYKGVMFVWPWIKNFLGIKDPPKPCGGCYNDQICDDKLNKCRKNCKVGESYYDNGGDGICCDNTTNEVVDNVCIPKCAEDKIRCGSTDCLNPADEECEDGKICKSQFIAYKETETGGIVKKCCGKDGSGNQLYPKNGECEYCLGEKCGSNCCPTKDGPEAKDINHPENTHPGTQCVAPDYCCDPKFVGKDDVTGKEVCCQNELCGDKCCSGDKKCNKNAVGGPKCQIKCGDEFCPDDSDLCVNNNGTLKCYPKSCGWGQDNYLPPAIYDRTGNTQNLRSVCLAGGNPINSVKPMVAVSDVNPVMNSDTYISLDSRETNQRCKTVDACLAKIQTLGLENAVFDLTVKNNICQGKTNCSVLLPKMDELRSIYEYKQDDLRQYGYYEKTLCPAKKIDGTDDVNCCYDKKTKEFNGYVCSDNQLCYNDKLTDQQYCYKKGSTPSASYNLNNCSSVVEPTIIKNTLSCECPKGTHAGSKCQFSAANQCNNNGTVSVNSNDDFICACKPGYEGINCQNIKILDESYLQMAGLISMICDGCHIVAGPGVTLTLNPVSPTVKYPDSNLFVSTSGVSVNYTAKYGVSGVFSGNVSLKNCSGDYYGYFPQVTGTNNFVVKSAAFGKNAGVAVIGIPILANITDVIRGKTIKYLDWDSYDCNANSILSTNYWTCSNSNEKCCSTNKSGSGYCAYDSSPCNRDSPYLDISKPALNKSIVEATEGKGYYIV